MIRYTRSWETGGLRRFRFTPLAGLPMTQPFRLSFYRADYLTILSIHERYRGTDVVIIVPHPQLVAGKRAKIRG